MEPIKHTQPLVRIAMFAATLTPFSLPTAMALDCATREPEHDDPAWSCRSAQTLMAANVARHGGDETYRCIPASDFATWGCLDLDTDARLCSAGGSFNMSVYLSRSGTSINCAGETLAPRGGQIGNSPRSAFRTPYSRSVRDIRIDNCQIVGSPGYGVDLKRYFRADESCLYAPSQHELQTEAQPDCEGALVGHQNIRISNLGISGASRIGIYVGQASRDVTISRVDIDAAYMGVYIEASTTGTRITEAVITNSHQREAIAIDSARYNLVEHSVFERNGLDVYSGINLYKNAGEYEGQVCPVVRPWGADHNIIRYNHFYKDDVNMASRESRDSYWNCAKYHYCSFNYRDRASANVFVDNVFHDGAQLDLLDDTFTVHGNRFEPGAELEVGAKQHTYALHGVVAQNIFEVGSSIRLNESDWTDLDIRNNMDAARSCLGDRFGGRNQCGTEWTVVFGEQVLSAGLLAVLF